MRGAPSLQELFGISDVMEFKERQSNDLGDALAQNYRYYEDERLREEERRRKKFAKERQIQGALVGGGLGAIFAPALGLAATPGAGALTGAKMGSQVGQDDLVGAAQTGIGAYLGGQQRKKAAEAAQHERDLDAEEKLFDRAAKAADVYWKMGVDLPGFNQGMPQGAQAQLPAQGGQLPDQAQLPSQGVQLPGQPQLPATEGRRLMSPKAMQEQKIDIDKENREAARKIKEQELKLKPQVDAAVTNIRKSQERVQKLLNKEVNMTKQERQHAEMLHNKLGLKDKDGNPIPYKAPKALEESTGGWWNMAMAKWNPGSTEYDFAADIKQIEAANAINSLMEIKRASPTGGALGSVTEGELETLKNMAANLDLGQSPAQLRERLENFDRELAKTLSKIEGFEEAVEQDEKSNQKIESFYEGVSERLTMDAEGNLL